MSGAAENHAVNLAGPRRPFGERGAANRPGPGRSPVALSHQLGLSPLPATGASQAAYLLIDITTDGVAEQTRLPLNVCLVIDQSHSMRGEKFDRAREAARHLLAQMSPDDVMSIVTFNDRATVICPPALATHKEQMASPLDMVVPRGGTELATGMEWGISQLHDGLNLTGQANSALLLLTDGRTYGDEMVCAELADYARKQGFIISPFGLGEEWNEDLLESLANRCGSRSEYIETPAAIVPAFRAHFERLRSIVGYNAHISFAGAGGTQVTQAYRVRPVVDQVAALLAAEPEEQVFDLGSLVAGEQQTLLVEAIVPPLDAGEHKLLDVVLSYQQAVVGRVRSSVAHHVQVPVAAQGQSSPQLAPEVKSAAEKVMAYRLQRNAWQDMEEGNLAQATHKLRMVATRLIEAGETELAAQVRAEAEYLERHGHTSASGPKQIKYGTRGLGATQGMPGAPPAGHMRSS